jgi:hypothetical protein
MQKSIVTMFALLLALGVMVRTQSPPDLSGTWTLDAAKSDPEPDSAGRAARAGTAGGGATNQLIVTQTPMDVGIRQGNLTIDFKLDGSETFYFQQGEVRATARWEGPTFVVSWKKEFFAGPAQGYVTTTGKDSYSLSGGILTVEKATTTPQGTTTRKSVYSRS